MQRRDTTQPSIQCFVLALPASLLPTFLASQKALVFLLEAACKAGEAAGQRYTFMYMYDRIATRADRKQLSGSQQENVDKGQYEKWIPWPIKDDVTLSKLRYCKICRTIH